MPTDDSGPRSDGPRRPPEPQRDKQDNELGRLSLVLGVSALPMLFVLGLGIPLGVAAIVLGAVGRRRASQGYADNTGESLTGLLCGAVTLVLAAILIARPDS